MTTRDDLALANRLADAARAAIRPFFRARYDMEFKSDQSPVTEADRAAEAAIRAILEKERPQDGIIGEEYRSEEHTSELQSLMRNSYAVLRMKKTNPR